MRDQCIDHPVIDVCSHFVPAALFGQLMKTSTNVTESKMIKCALVRAR